MKVWGLNAEAGKGINVVEAGVIKGKGRETHCTSTGPELVIVGEAAIDKDLGS